MKQNFSKDSSTVIQHSKFSGKLTFENSGVTACRAAAAVVSHNTLQHAATCCNTLQHIATDQKLTLEDIYLLLWGGYDE